MPGQPSDFKGKAFKVHGCTFYVGRGYGINADYFYVYKYPENDWEPAVNGKYLLKSGRLDAGAFDGYWNTYVGALKALVQWRKAQNGK